MTISPRQLRLCLPNPKDIMIALDEYIVGQERAKKTLALMLLNRSMLELVRGGVLEIKTPIQKSNVLLIGPTGTGKTALIKALSKIIRREISIFDVTSITSAGYVGGNVEDILINHVETCEEQVRDQYNDPSYLPKTYSEAFEQQQQKQDTLIDLVETGIVYLDEIDKIKQRTSTNHTSNIDVNGDMVQNELLKILDPGTTSLLSNKNSCSVSQVVTDSIIFICGGAFSGLADIIARRLEKDNSIGFNAQISTATTNAKKQDLLKYVTNDDLIEYGFKPEFLGRLPLKTTLDPLSESTIAGIINMPKNSVLNEYVEMFQVFGVQLKITKDAISEIAKIAVQQKTGARSLKTIFFNLLSDELCNIFQSEKEVFTITKKLVQNRALGNEV